MEDQQAIRNLRTDFLKYLKDKNWSALEDLLVPHARFTSNKSHHSYRGCNNIIGCLRQRFEGPDAKVAFHLHTPEISVTAPDRAFGMWHLTERSENSTVKRMTYRIGYVHDRYEKQNGVWKLAFAYHEILSDEFTPPSTAFSGIREILPLAS